MGLPVIAVFNPTVSQMTYAQKAGGLAKKSTAPKGSSQ